MVNRIELNQARPDGGGSILAGSVPDSDGAAGGDGQAREKGRQLTLNLPEIKELQNVIYARMVQKVGDRRYWEQWAKDVSAIAQGYIDRINRLIAGDGPHKRAFEEFLAGVRKNLNPAVAAGEVVEMLAQHLITKPVFEALFEDRSFVKNNPVSQSLQRMVDLLEEQALEKDALVLGRFYESVKTRVAGLDNPGARQKVILELYDKFFKTAFPLTVEKLGIVYTPVEVVDFINQSVAAVLEKEFGRSLSDPNVHILDPFTGTGTFIVRLIQSGLISESALARKYGEELHANEIILLAYYIASVNIENAYHELTGKGKYAPFGGICLTDTFQLGETDDAKKLISEFLPKNSSRVVSQTKTPIRVILGNPPYSVGQKSANDNARNQAYPRLDRRIGETYVKRSEAGLNKSVYDSYIKAFRWSSDRLDKERGGIIAFVSNAGWLDGNAMDGMRKCLESEFSAIYVFNLRGNCRTSGEVRRKEKDNVFGLGSRTPIAITILVKKPGHAGKAVIRYHDIGDYLSREEKLEIVRKNRDIYNPEMRWTIIKPNEQGDWLNQRNSSFEEMIQIEPMDKFNAASKSFFAAQSLGTVSARDSWVYNYSIPVLQANIRKTIKYYNEQVKQIASHNISEPLRDAKKGNWTRDWENLAKRKYLMSEKTTDYRLTAYRPFTKLNHCCPK